MSRWIKFKVWDTERKQMEYRDLQTLAQYGWPRVGAREAIADGKLMQCIGLRDKNGVEIYEGDILSYAHCTGVVEYKAPRFVISDMIWSLDVCEVIGNIYENSELLESTNDK